MSYLSSVPVAAEIPWNRAQPVQSAGKTLSSSFLVWMWTMAVILVQPQDSDGSYLAKSLAVVYNSFMNC